MLGVWKPEEVCLNTALKVLEAKLEEKMRLKK